MWTINVLPPPERYLSHHKSILFFINMKGIEVNSDFSPKMIASLIPFNFLNDSKKKTELFCYELSLYVDYQCIASLLKDFSHHKCILLLST